LKKSLASQEFHTIIFQWDFKESPYFDHDKLFDKRSTERSRRRLGRAELRVIAEIKEAGW
jgi:hypothetical protein